MLLLNPVNAFYISSITISLEQHTKLALHQLWAIKLSRLESAEVNCKENVMNGSEL